MKKISILFFVLLLVTSCHHYSTSTKKKEAEKVNASAEGIGSSFADAVVIDASNESDGVAEEYKWLKANYPGYSLISQTLVYDGGKPYDVMNIKTSSGEKKKIYFDISSFFGKF